MPEKKKHGYLPMDLEKDVGSHEYITKGSLSHYPLSKWKKTEFNYGVHFSQHVRGMFLYPRAAIRRILNETVTQKDVFVPLAVVLVAGVLTAIGGSLWSILLTPSVLISFFSAMKLFVMIFAMPIWFIALWLVWAGVLHSISSVMSGRDILNTHALHKSFKAVGFAFVPAFLNILPLFSLITAYWTWILCAWAMEINYGLSKKSAFIATLPLLFATIFGTFIRLSVL
ncbi:MAG: YIP1 family protein [archaeon]